MEAAAENSVDIDIDILSGHRAAVQSWLRAWNTPELAREATIEWSPRLTRSLGRCYPRRGLIRIAAPLKTASPSFLEEVLCHELAHLAAATLHGDAVRPHGRQWKALMRAAGFTPKTRLAAPEGFGAGSRKRRKRRRTLYVHRCPVCRTGRTAGRSMPRWRCAACHVAGLDGMLTVTLVVPRLL